MKTIEQQVNVFANDTYSNEDGVHGIKTYGQTPYFVNKLTQALQERDRIAEERGIAKGREEERERIRPFVKRVRLDVDVIVCDCGEKYKDSDLDLSVGELEQTLTK